MSEGVEIERKFVVARLPEDLAGGGWRAELVEQGYLAITPDLEVRVRRRGSGQARRTTLTIKSAPALARVEEELALAAEAFERLWPLTAGRRLVKTRYVREAGPAVLLELDVYAGALEGLATLEVEFADEAASRAFTPPAWAGREVTGDPAYANQTLAVHGRP
jgi:CYTH domain-containing protein